jgi:hypothetical protein
VGINGKPQILLHKLLLILHRGFVESRNLALSQNTQALYDLADTFEVVPALMAKGDEDAFAQIRGILAHYQSKRSPSGYDYLAILDMDDAAFEQVHGRECLPDECAE